MNNVVQARPASNRQQPVTAGFHVESQNRKLGVWLEGLVSDARVKGAPIVSIIKLTPELAELLLNRNPANRKINANMVDSFASDMAGRRWAMNGEPIIISDTGELNDGQHRCMAVRQSGATIDAILVVGVSRDSRTTLDQGRQRSISDYLSMDGHADSKVLGAAANHLWSYRNRGMLYKGGGTSRLGATKSEIRQTVIDNPGLERSVVIAGRQALAIGGRAIVAFTHFVLSAQNREAADQFVLSLMDGAGLKSNDPILYARNRLINERGRLFAPDKAELLFKSWNAWRTGTSYAHLRIQGGPLPVLEA